MRLRTLCALGLGALALAASAAADPAPKPATSADRTAWEQRLREAHEAVALAEARSRAADAAYQEMRHRKYPRGEARAAIEAERTLAQAGVASAHAHLEELLAEARRANVPPGWMRAAEAPPQPAAPAPGLRPDDEAADESVARPADDPYDARAADLPYGRTAAEE